MVCEQVTWPIVALSAVVAIAATSIISMFFMGRFPWQR